MSAPSAFPMSSVLSVLQVKENGVCEVQSRLTNGFTLTLTSNTVRHSYYQVFGVLSSMCEDLPPDANFRPDNGSTVAVDTPDGWQRGYVISVLDENSYRIALCDSCGILSVKSNKLRSLPLQFLTIPTFGVKVIIEGNLQPSKAELVKPGVRFKFQILRSDTKTATVILTSTNIATDIISCRATLVPWVPRFEDKGLRCIKLKNKCKAQIISYSSQHDIYLCPMDDYNVELRNSVIQDVVAYCIDAPDLERLPDPGELVACRFTSDEIYYRAQVIVCDRERIQVAYVDFGNVEYVTLDRLKPLSDELKQIPCTAVHVSLRNVRQCPLSKSAINLFDMIIMSDSEVIVNFTDSYSKGVTLTSDTNDNINIMIDELLIPLWKLALDSGDDCIDWGNTEIVSTSFIRKMPQEISDFPALANRCQIHGLPENLSYDLRTKLEELIPFYSVHTVKVNSRMGEIYYLDMPNITALLEEDGYL